MNYYYDVLLNLKKDNLYFFYEWDQKDELTHYKKIPLFKVDTKTLIDFINYNIVLEKDFLAIIKNKSIEYIDDNLSVVPYIFIVSDAKTSLAVKYDLKNKKSYCSNLLINDDLNIIEIVYNFKITKINYLKQTKILHPTELRQEREIKNNLLINLNNYYQHQKYDLLKYIYYEMFSKKSSKYLEIVKELKDDINENFNSKHLELNDLINILNKKCIN